VWDKAESRGNDALTALKMLLGGNTQLYRLEAIRDPDEFTSRRFSHFGVN